jgi:hypothetical protein
LAFWSETEKGIFTVAADGSDRSERLVGADSRALYPSAWSPDVAAIAFIRESPRLELLTVSTQAPHEVRPLASGAGANVEASFSPDGRWVTHVAFDGDIPEIVVGPTGTTDRRWPVAGRGRQPSWTRDGRAVLFLEAGAIHAVTIASATGLPVGRPMKLVDLPRLATTVTIEQTPDGSRFLMLERLENENQAPEIRIVMNWNQDLRARLANAAPPPSPTR